MKFLLLNYCQLRYLYILMIINCDFHNTLFNESISTLELSITSSTLNNKKIDLYVRAEISSISSNFKLKLIINVVM